MDSNTLQCSVCYEDYDLDGHLPRILPYCGHSFCTKCLQKLLNGTELACPKDKTAYFSSLPNMNSFPVNFDLKDIIEKHLEKASQWRICELHGHFAEYYCIPDKSFICRDCGLLGEHKSHDIKRGIDIESQINEKKKTLKAVLLIFDALFKDAKIILEKRREKCLEIVQDGFEEIGNLQSTEE